MRTRKCITLHIFSVNGMEIDESFSQLPHTTANAAECDDTIRILNDHGISINEDTDGTLLNSALQGGRQLVLSDAGKLILNDPKYKTVMAARPAPAPATTTAAASRTPSTTSTINGSKSPATPLTTTTTTAAATATQNANRQTIFVAANTQNQQFNQSNSTLGPIRFETMRKKPNAVFVPNKSSAVASTTAGATAAANGVKPNKVIKILSAEEFKQLCGANAASAKK